MRLILVGPSHIPRIRHALEVVGLPRPVDEILYFGDGGFPVWKKSVFEQCCNEYRDGDKILLIVADFRFGNSILCDKSCNINDAVFFNGHTHVNRELCTLENDEQMKKLCVKALLKWKERFGDKLIILHWTLAMRTVKNRLSRQHVDSNGKYRHPVWNIDEPVFKTDVAGLSALQTTNELNICNSLTIDNDLHPSTLGYLYIIANTVTANHENSLMLAKTVYMAGINTLSSQLSNKPLQKTLFFGTSKVLNSITNAIPMSSRAALKVAGLEILKQGETLDSIIQIGNVKNLIYISDNVINDQVTLDKCISNIRKELSGITDTKISILFWDAIATQVMQWRARNQRNAPTGLIEKSLAANIFHTFWSGSPSTFEFQSIDRLVEYGAGGAPTFWGILSVLTTAANSTSNGISNAVINSMSISAKNQSLVLSDVNPLASLNLPS